MREINYKSEEWDWSEFKSHFPHFMSYNTEQVSRLPETQFPSVNGGTYHMEL